MDTNRINGEGRPAFVTKYLVHWIKYPDPSSAFARKTFFLRWLPGFVLVWLLLRLDYDGFVLCDNEMVIGHVFFQKHKADWRAFSVFVKEEYRGNAYAQLLLLKFMDAAHADPKITAVRLGAGGDKAIVNIWRKFLAGSIVVPFAIEEGDFIGWIRFVR